VSVRIPGPPQLLPGCPDAIIDLQTPEGAALADGQWRYSDTQVRETGFVSVGPDLGPSGPANRTYEVVPRAHAADFDDSAWTVLAPADTQRRLSTGRVCFNWYRITVTIPERVGDLDPTGCTVVFETVVDDYAEIWVNGEQPLALGDAGGHVVAGFNAPNRAVLTRVARPGQQFTIAVFGINGPISAAPSNYIWMRTATLDFYTPARSGTAEEVTAEIVAADAGVTGSARSCRRARGWNGWRAALSSPRDRYGPATARCCSARPTPTPSTGGRRSARSPSSARPQGRDEVCAHRRRIAD
jgi:hypothetical protein